MKRFHKLLNSLNDNYGHKLDHWWLGYLLCVVGFGLTILAFYPGYMSPDSIANLTSGREGNFYDINSPVMSYFWGVLDTIYPGPALMLIFHNLIFWSGCAFFWKAAKNRSSKLGIGLILLGFMPQILSQLSTIWKDVGLTVSLFFITSVFYYSVQKNSKIFLYITPLFFFYAYAARLNSFPAIFPLLVWMGLIICQVFSFNAAKTRKILFVTLFSLFSFTTLTIIVFLVNNHLTEGKTTHPFQQVLLYDLAAISKERNKAFFPDYVLQGENFSLEKVRSEYNLRSINTLIYGDRPTKGDSPILKLSRDPNEIKQLWNKWYETILDNKLLYLRHRYNLFAQLTGFTTDTVTYPYWDPGFSYNPPEFRPAPNFLNKVFMTYFHLVRKFIFFRGFFWLGLCVFFIYKAFRNKFQGDWQMIFILSISAIFYALAYFPTTPSTEFRYLLWSELAAAIATVFAFYLLIKNRLKKNSETEGAKIEV